MKTMESDGAAGLQMEGSVSFLGKLRQLLTLRTAKLENFLLWSLLVVNVISIFGFAVFSLNPQMIGKYPWTAPIFAVSYPLFAQMQILIAFAAIATCASRLVGTRWLLPFAGVFTISFLAEFMGTSTGIPFGYYEYTTLLGPMILDKVPYLIPISWFFMAVPAFDLATRVFSRKTQWLTRILFASFLLLAWDLTLDPAMSHLTPFWLWEQPGFYYGAPLMNLVGWYVTGIAIMILLELTGSIEWIKQLPRSFSPIMYGLNIMLPFFMVVFAGLWPAALLTLAVFALYALLYQWQQKRSFLRALY